MKSKNIKIQLHESFDYAVEELSKEAQELLTHYKTKNKYGYDRIIYEVELPCKVDWCSYCDGSGGRSKYDIEGYDIDRMITDEYGETDYEFKEDYFSGKTDITCNMCDGTKIENIRDYDACNKLQKEILKKDNECYQNEADERAEREAERRMGA